MGRKTIGGPHDNPKRILMTRLSAIGDCILTIPLAVQVKQLWPESHLTWLVECKAYELLEAHPAIDEVLRIERGWLQRPKQWFAWRRQLQSRGFDLVLDPQGLTKSSLLGWLSGARTRIGFDSSHGRELALLLDNYRVRRTFSHMVDRYLQLLSPWTEIVAGQGEFSMPSYAAAAQTASSVLAQRGMSDGPWVAINPGAGWTTRLWPVHRYGMLARELYRELGLRSLVFWSGDAERDMARVIEQESWGAAFVAPQTSLSELLELLRRATLLVTGDTGPLHIASAVGTPCVSLHGPTWADESGPYRNPHIAIQSPSPYVSRKMVRKGPNIAMQAIGIEEVYRACTQLLVCCENAARLHNAARDNASHGYRRQAA